MEQVAQEQITREPVAYPLFMLGQIVATRGAISIGDISLLNPASIAMYGLTGGMYARKTP